MEAIDIVEKWTNKVEMQINKKKSGVMFIKKQRRKDQDRDAIRAAQQIKGYPIVEEYKYLGVIFDNVLRFDKNLEKIRENIKKGSRLIEILLWKNSNFWLIFYTWITYITPHFRYGALVYLPKKGYGKDIRKWNKTSFEYIKLYNRTAKLMGRIPINTPLETM